MLAIIHCDQINQVKQENGVIQIGSNKNSDKNIMLLVWKNIIYLRLYEKI